MYRGAWPSVLRALPSYAASFWGYEATLSLLEKQQQRCLLTAPQQQKQQQQQQQQPSHFHQHQLLRPRVAHFIVPPPSPPLKTRRDTPRAWKDNHDNEEWLLG